MSTDTRTEKEKMIAGEISDSNIETPFQCDLGYNIYWGENSFANYNFVVLDTCSVYVAPRTACNLFLYGKPIRIGNNVWIGGGSIIGAGASIGDNSVIGAGSVVDEDIPANAVAVRNSCKVIKQLQPPTRPPKEFQQMTGFDYEKLKEK
ncbi:unnamed protein product [Adineta steineri]|uniref:Acetyltransferase n=1 Tax=Adineta steineri TaxID=433720 RepID=A0A814BCA4_9BILA|nr:unnamed protein product [Adineta steineri]CAF4131483.1 unnamed protein product [Adineta steineri]